MDFVPMRDNYFFAGVPKSPTVQSCVHINFVQTIIVNMALKSDYFFDIQYSISTERNSTKSQ